METQNNDKPVPAPTNTIKRKSPATSPSPGPIATKRRLDNQEWIYPQRNNLLYRWFPIPRRSVRLQFADMPYIFTLDYGRLFAGHTLERYVSYIMFRLFGKVRPFEDYVRVRDRREIEVPFNFPVELLLFDNDKRRNCEELKLSYTSSFYSEGRKIRTKLMPTVHVTPEEIKEFVVDRDCPETTVLTNQHPDLVYHYPHPVYLLWIVVYSSSRNKAREVYYRLPIANTLTLRQALLKHLSHIVPLQHKLGERAWYMEDLLNKYMLDMEMPGANFAEWYYDHYVKKVDTAIVGVFKIHYIIDTPFQIHHDLYVGPANKEMPPPERFDELDEPGIFYFQKHYQRIAEKHKRTPVTQLPGVKAVAPVLANVQRICGSCRTHKLETVYFVATLDGILVCQDCAEKLGGTHAVHQVNL